MTVEFLDPTHEAEAAGFRPAERLDTLLGATVALLSNGKKGTQPFFDALATDLVERHGVARVVRLTKTNYSAPAEAGLFGEAERWNALIAGVGD